MSSLASVPQRPRGISESSSQLVDLKADAAKAATAAAPEYLIPLTQAEILDVLVALSSSISECRNQPHARTPDVVREIRRLSELKMKIQTSSDRQYVQREADAINARVSVVVQPPVPGIRPMSWNENDIVPRKRRAKR